MNMVEIVGRAVVDHLGVSLAFTEPLDTDTPTIRKLRDADTKQALAIARAAIEAMIIPTNGMLGEAAKAMSPGKRPTPEYVSVNQKHKIRYQAMIRKALEE